MNATIGILVSQILILGNLVHFQTTNPNVGFGFSADCAASQYLDFCVNGPLVGNDGLPVGGYIDNGVQKKEWTNPNGTSGNFGVDNGIFGLDTQGVLRMCSYEGRNQFPQMKWAFQNGPILVQDGKNIRGTSMSRYVRSGVGFNQDNEIIVLVSEDPVTFWEFAELFVRAGCVSAIYLDGGPYVGWSDNQGRAGMKEGSVKLQFYNN